MGYELHIERDGPIAVEEWTNAVAQVDKVTLRSDDSVAIDPQTGEEIRIPANDGDAVVTIPNGSLGLRWSSSGRASFRATDDWDDATSSLRTTIFALAQQLDARVVGDEGEEYGSPDRVEQSKPWWKLW